LIVKLTLCRLLDNYH